MFKSQENSDASVNPAILRRLISPGQLSYEKFFELASDAVVETLPKGSKVFETGQDDGSLIYLLKGELEATYPDGHREVFRAGDNRSKHPLAAEQPHSFTAVCRTNASLAKFNYMRYESMVNPLEASINVSELGDTMDDGSDSAWMTRILQSPNFRHIPPANLQSMFMCLKETPLPAGHRVINQGDKADHYYIIKRGSCSVQRNNKSGARVLLEKLKVGDVFGEEALLTNGVRNATVVMDTSGSVLKLDRQDFMKLLAEPLLKKVNLEQAQDIVGEDGVYLDVRPRKAPAPASIPAASHTPLYLLRLAMQSMDRDRKYVCFCEDGTLSLAATFLMGSAGFQAFCLSGGLAKAA